MADSDEKRADRLKKLRELHRRRNEARQLNHQEVIEEDKRNKLPTNWEAKKRRAEWELDEDRKKQEAVEKGEDYERLKMLDQGADEIQRFEKRKKKKNPDPGFSNFEDATIRQYNRLVKNLKPDMESYEKQKEKLGNAFYADNQTIIHGLHKDSPEAIQKLAEGVEKQIAKRDKFSRRRTFDPDADIDYINERNMRFNKKIERFYGQYTSEIKQNLERGTAV
ncbi:unnamed protein product [Darwinula stevensoni]|uniref:Pre-mRNA-splicing factor SYF2 n=1 Tax=Darwinula stevensoni TaxID=69355 RepID=A0A7R8X611_9CRUS|nr:unnamed protein product [Darwinula stevensoni]CAG0880760.1 unnamed protein product [Darwinula stevensoni]